MRPNMRFRGEIETGRDTGLLLVPARRGLPARRRARWCGRAGAWAGRRLPVRLGRSNRRQVEIAVGPRGGRPAEPDRPRRPSGGAAARVGRRRRVERAPAGLAHAAAPLLALAMAAAALWLGAGARLARTLRARRASPPSRCKRERFVREVAATGTLRAVRATPIVAPPQSGRPAEDRHPGPRRHGPDRRATWWWSSTPTRRSARRRTGRPTWPPPRPRSRSRRRRRARPRGTLTLDRDVAKDALGRAEEFQLTDEGLFSRNEIIESRLDKALFTKKADVAGRKLTTSGKLSARRPRAGRDRGGQGALQGQQRGEEPGLAAHPGPARRPPDPGEELARRDRLRGRLRLAGPEAGRDPRPLPARGARVRAGDGRRRPQAGAGAAASPSRAGRGRSSPGSVSRVDALAKPRDQQSPVKYFETTVALDRTDAVVHEAGPARARGDPAGGGGGRASRCRAAPCSTRTAGAWSTAGRAAASRRWR